MFGGDCGRNLEDIGGFPDSVGCERALVEVGAAEGCVVGTEIFFAC